LCATFSANVNINYRLPIKVYYRICTLIHIRIEINQLGRFPLEIRVKLRMIAFWSQLVLNEIKLSSVLYRLMSLRTSL
jgi:hypothetical protein